MSHPTLCELMQLSDPQDAASDFVRKFIGTYVRLLHTGRVAYVSKPRDSDTELCTLHSNPDKIGDAMPIPRPSGQPVEIPLEPVFPTNGLFTDSGRLYYSSRIPARQYRRPTCIDNYYVVDLFHRLLGTEQLRPTRLFDGYVWARGGERVSDSLRIVQSAVDPVYLPWGTPLPNLDSGYALSNLWGVTRNPAVADSNAIVLWQGNCVVATGNFQNITVCNDILRQELLDFVRRNNIGVTIK